jgi:hypothetical protein
MSENKIERRPVIDPVLMALKSRRVIVALAALIVGLLTLAVPELEPVRAELLTLVITLALAVIGGYTVEDAAHAARDRVSTPPQDLRETIKEVLDGMVDEIADSSQTPSP